jgi:entericidin A
MVRKGTWSLAVLACLVMLTGCNTIAGMGKDVQKVGEKVEEKAQDCKDAKC